MHVQLKYVYGQSGINNNKQRGTHGLTQLGEINSDTLQTTQAIPHAKEKKINKVHPSFHTKHTDNQLIQTGFAIRWRGFSGSAVCFGWCELLRPGFSCRSTVNPGASFPHCPEEGASWDPLPSIPALMSSNLRQTRPVFLAVVLNSKKTSANQILLKQT